MCACDNENQWTTPPADLSLPCDEVHLWRCRVDIPAEALRRCHRILDPTEQNRARHFARAGDRNRFIVSRAHLRLILATYLHRQPEDISILTGLHGKPYLPGGDPSLHLEFNVAHSGSLALVGVTAASRSLGVDVEWAGRKLTPLKLARRVLAPSELAILKRTPTAARKNLFLNIWVIKEAVAKALGRGISMPLSSFAVTFPHSGPPQIQTEHGAHGLTDLTVVQLRPGVGHLGAVAADCPPWSLRRWSATHMLTMPPRPNDNDRGDGIGSDDGLAGC